MRALFCLVLALVLAPAARADENDCLVARASAVLATRYGLDPTPFQVLAGRACGGSSPERRPRTFRLAADQSQFFNIPDDTDVVIAAGSQVRQFINLPENLRALNVANTGISQLLNLPDHLEALDLSGTKVTMLLNLPSSLRYLDLRGTQVRSLLNLPDSVECVVADGPLSGRNVVRSPRECGLSNDWMRFMTR